jgi:hypothetical protein
MPDLNQITQIKHVIGERIPEDIPFSGGQHVLALGISSKYVAGLCVNILMKAGWIATAYPNTFRPDHYVVTVLLKR